MLSAAFLLCLLPTAPVPASVDFVEVNTVYDGPLERFTQIIFWSGSPLHVRHWEMTGAQVIYRVAGRDAQPITVIRKGFRVVRARRFLRSHTRHDPERDDARLLPVDARRPLP